MKTLIIAAGLALAAAFTPAVAQVDASPNADVRFRTPSSTSSLSAPASRAREFSSSPVRSGYRFNAPDRHMAPNGGGNF